MPVPDVIQPSIGNEYANFRELPRWGLWKGLLAGIALEIPTISAAVLALSKFGFGRSLQVMFVIRVTSIFAGVPALVTAAGLGRLAAARTVQRGRRAAIASVTWAHALAGMLLLMIAALPHGAIPTTGSTWLALVGLGALAGSCCGAAIGIVCTGAPPRQGSEMFSLVKLPGTTLRQLIDSEDLGRIGAAVRQGASLMFDGLLDPAAPRPENRAEESAPPPATTTVPREAPPSPARDVDAGAAIDGAERPDDAAEPRT